MMDQDGVMKREGRGSSFSLVKLVPRPSLRSLRRSSTHHRPLSTMIDCTTVATCIYQARCPSSFWLPSFDRERSLREQLPLPQKQRPSASAWPGPGPGEVQLFIKLPFLPGTHMFSSSYYNGPLTAIEAEGRPSDI